MMKVLDSESATRWISGHDSGKARRLVEGMTAGAVVGNLAGMAIATRASTASMDDGAVERARKRYIGERVTRRILGKGLGRTE